jgi:fermentation-respiration switch protein FrsA (DUF1100 family)
MSATIQRVTFKNGDIDISCDLRLPNGFDRSASYPAVVLVTPGSSVKEQIGANYASRLSDAGYVTLAFDPAFQGESGGSPRDLEDPSARIEDVRCAIDLLVTLPYVDEERIGVLGICAGGGYAVATAMIEHRIKAVGTVVPVNIGRAFRQSGSDAKALRQTLEEVGRQRTAVARGGEHRWDNWLPDTLDAAREAGIGDPDTLEAVTYYRTSRGYSANSTNKMLFRSNALLIGFDAFHLVGELLTQPVQVIVGGRLGTTFSYGDGRELWERARRKEDFVAIEGAGHYQLYDEPAYVDQAVTSLLSFYGKHLSGQA